ncbi:MAG: ATP-binding cassette domain-containing protein, partial [Myxococcota bacterium]
RVIHTLSRGYRQRVGLAQAIVHDPKVLILDEPTSGLDPVQIVEIRNLIRNLAAEAGRTVILSTHILPEVEAICQRVLLISQGRIRVDGTLADVTRDGSLEEVFLREAAAEREREAAP